ncbi:GNAT family N-acetyltransferase [Nannocystis pusilla]|uniref:GNAT family N-acetyltransferase n=1 Tax=Nannocystis pusilla TaxID=889268 RepID=A0ABS7TI70_9BACT|nr:GNAT family N-acetyltransferase [Nannocystis pusilla]MBZ5707909.1 GNAT family N-acetyltransferase [Nannocystis pusilla]
MRKQEFFGMTREEAIALLATAPVIRLASVGERGQPVLRTLHAVVLDEALYFHAAPVGEKSETVGQAAVMAADEMVATIPSHVFDPERACPATTYYRSAQAHGTLEAVEDSATKARMLQALMEKYQPEGGYAPITADDPRYRGAVRGIAVIRMRLERVDGKAKLGQNRSADDLARVLRFLWQRGEPGDPRAVDLVRAANPNVPAPEFLSRKECPEGARLCCALGAGDLPEAVALLEGEYWNADVPRDRIVRCQVSSSAWVGARDEQGRLIATGRALGDGARWAYLLDIAVARPWRGRGLGKALVRLLLDHPQVRGCRRVHLRTRDAQRFYEDFGFRERVELPGTEMVLKR